MSAKPPLAEPFTMTEYIAHHKLNVSPRHAGATRVIAEELRKKGFFRQKVYRNGKVIIGYTSEPRPDLEELRDLLRKIK